MIEVLEQIALGLGFVALLFGAPYLIFGGDIFGSDARNDRGGMPG